MKITMKYGRRGRRRALIATIAACGALAAASPAALGVSAAPTANRPAEAGSSVPESAPTRGGHLNVVHSTNPSTLDPIASGAGGDYVSLYPIYERLINFDPETFAPLPGLASAWDFPDELTLHLTLEQGITFHDGTDFNAEAVKFNLERAMTDERSTVKADLDMIESVEAVGDYDVLIHLSRPDSTLVLMLADRPGMMVSPAAVEEYGDDFQRHPVGAGPFAVVDWAQNDRLELERFDGYWRDGLPYLDSMTIRYIADEQTAMNALLSGEVDFATQVNPSRLESLQDTDGIVTTSTPSLAFEDCKFNFSIPPFDNASARLALNYAIDRDEINDLFLFSTGTPISEVYPPGYWAEDPERQDFFAYDPDLARSYLEEAGYPDGFTITGLVTDTNSQARKSEIIQAQLARVGIQYDFEVVEAGSITPLFFDGLQHNILCVSWSGRPDPSQTANSLFSPDSYANAGHYSSPGMSEALAQASMGTSEERAEAFREVIRIAQEDALIAPLVSRASTTAGYDYVEGYQPDRQGKPNISFIWLAAQS